MATFKRFEDIQAWQEARVVTVDIHKICRTGEFAKDFDLRFGNTFTKIDVSSARTSKTPWTS
jgi:hypothetical protein